ncbi:MAG: hypothetical protein Q9181_004449 [Wetmoreana brouardii]
MIGSGVLSSFLLLFSLHLSQSRVIQNRARQSLTCTYDALAPVIAWPEESWYERPKGKRHCGRLTNLYSHLESASTDSPVQTSEQGLSCPAVSHNSRCFPIWQSSNEPSDSALEPRDLTPYKVRPVRQAPIQQTFALGPRSITLRWPDDMQHAVFFTDETCHDVQVGRPEFTWHVERLGIQIAQCESPPAGLFRSVEFMRSEEYEAFSRRMRRQDGLSTNLPGVAKLITGLLTCYVIYYIYWQFTVGARRRWMIKKHGCKPVKNTPKLNSWKDCFFGWTQLVLNAQAFKERRLLEHSRQRFLRNGNTFNLKIAFTDMVFTIEPDNLKSMLATNFEIWNLPDRRKEAFAPLFGKGIFTTDGAAWQHSRELLRPNFVRNQVADLATYETHIGHLIGAIPRDGSTIDLNELFFRLTIDSATEFLFGESTNCLAPGASSEYATEFANAFNRSQETAGVATRGIPILIKLLPRSDIKRDVKYVHQFVDRYVKLGLDWQKKRDLEKSTSNGGERYVFLHELVKVVKDPIRLRSELLNVLLAGRDTTASLLGNVWFLLARRPDVWAKLRLEVDGLAGERPTFELIKNMKYLRYVLNETLRLYPVVPANARMSVVDTVLPLGGGPDGKSPLFIPAKKTVAWSVYTMHRRKDLYGEDAEDFKPERWEKLRHGWEYLPFNGGPRICIGQQFALTEASYTTIRLIQEFKGIGSRDPEPWTEKVTITAAAQATLVALTPA